jgi:single-strand DNA-binding protein
MARVSIATKEFYKNAKGERVTETQWHTLVAWGKTAELMERYLKKGAELALQGKLVSRNYEDKEGIKRYVTEIHVSGLHMLGSKFSEE